MLVGRFSAVVFDLQRQIGVVVVVHLLRVHDHVCHDLSLVVKLGWRQPSQCLPDHGNQQDEGSASGGHRSIVGGSKVASTA